MTGRNGGGYLSMLVPLPTNSARRFAEHSFVSPLTANGAERYLVSIFYTIVYTRCTALPPSFRAIAIVRGGH